jgi:hypothetical protein
MYIRSLWVGRRRRTPPQVIGDHAGHPALPGGVGEVASRQLLEREPSAGLPGPAAHPLGATFDVLDSGERTYRQIERRRRFEPRAVDQREIGPQGRQEGRQECGMVEQLGRRTTHLQ